MTEKNDLVPAELYPDEDGERVYLGAWGDKAHPSAQPVDIPRRLAEQFDAAYASVETAREDLMTWLAANVDLGAATFEDWCDHAVMQNLSEKKWQARYIGCDHPEKAVDVRTWDNHIEPRTTTTWMVCRRCGRSKGENSARPGQGEWR